MSPAVGEAGVLKVSAVQGTGFRPRESKRLIDPSIFQAHHEVREGDALITRANTAEKVGAACLVGSLEGEASLFLSDKTL